MKKKKRLKHNMYFSLSSTLNLKTITHLPSKIIQIQNNIFIFLKYRRKTSTHVITFFTTIISIMPSDELYNTIKTQRLNMFSLHILLKEKKLIQH